MGTRILLIFFVVIAQFCHVLGRHSFYEYYYSRYHKGHSTTTEPIFQSTSDTFSSSEHEPKSSSSDYISWEKTNDRISIPDDNSLQSNQYEETDDTSLQNPMYEPTVYPFDDNFNTDYSSLRIGLIIAGAVISLCVFCCILCCIRNICTRKERRGFIIVSQPETAREVVPQQNTLMQQPPELQQPYHTQCNEERCQFSPPQYYPQPMQQFPSMQPQFHPSPSAPMQSHNPPEAPPPYDFPHKF